MKDKEKSKVQLPNTLSKLRHRINTLESHHANTIKKLIAKHKNTEKALRESKDQYKNLFDNAGNAIFFMDIDSKKGPLVKECNTHTLKLFGCKAKDMLGHGPARFSPKTQPDGQSSKEKALKLTKLVMKGHPQYFEWEHRRWDNQNTFYAGVTLSRIKLKGKRHMQAIVHDITELKKTEEALNNSNRRFRDIADNAKEMIWEVDTEGKYTHVSAIVEEILGFKPEELVGKKHFYDLFVPDQREELKREAFKVFARKEAFRDFPNANLHQDGHQVVLETSGLPILDKDGNLLGYRGADIDITTQKKAETALRESEERFRLSYQRAPLGYQSLNAEGKFIDVNPAWLKMLGYTRSEVIGRWFGDFLFPDYLVQFKKNFPLFKIAGEIHGVIFEMRRKNGKKIIVEFNGKIGYDPNGKFRQTHCILQNISHRVGIEKEREILIEKLQRKTADLEKMRIQNALILNCAGEGIYGLDLEGTTTFVNPAAASMIGWEVKDIIGKNQHALLHHSNPDGTSYPRKDCPIYAAFKDGKIHHVETEVFWRKDGSSFPVEYISTPIHNEKGVITGAVVTFKDITDRKLLEKTKANLIRDVSHGLKTPMAMTEMAINMLKKGLEKNDKNQIKESLKIGNNNILRMRRDIGCMLDAFTLTIKKTEKKNKKKKTKIMTIINKNIRAIQPLLLEKHIKIKIQLLKDARELRMDPSDAEILLHNIIHNAVKFTKQGCISITSCARKQHIEITIKDTGCGIAAKDRTRIFERFYKRHAAIEGTGLGLFISKEIVEMYNGKIEASSEGIGKGASVKITIPKNQN